MGDPSQRASLRDSDGAIAGGDTSEERIEHASETEAARVVRQKIRIKQRAGWVEVAVEHGADPNLQALAQGEAIERAIADNPSDLNNWAVYADWLQAINPLIGERVALGVALARGASKHARAQIEARIEQLEDIRGRELLGVTVAGVLATDTLDGVIELERKLGMIVAAKLRDRGPCASSSSVDLRLRT